MPLKYKQRKQVWQAFQDCHKNALIIPNKLHYQFKVTRIRNICRLYLDGVGIKPYRLRHASYKKIITKLFGNPSNSSNHVLPVSGQSHTALINIPLSQIYVLGGAFQSEIPNYETIFHDLYFNLHAIHICQKYFGAENPEYIKDSLNKIADFCNQKRTAPENKFILQVITDFSKDLETRRLLKACGSCSRLWDYSKAKLYCNDKCGSSAEWKRRSSRDPVGVRLKAKEAQRRHRAKSAQLSP